VPIGAVGIFVPTGIDRIFGQADSRGRSGRQPACKLVDGAVELNGIDDPGREAETQRLGGVQRFAEQRHLHSGADADVLLQEVRSGGQTALDEWRRHARVTGHDTEIGRQRQVEAGAVCKALDTGDDRLGQFPHQANGAGPAARPGDVVLDRAGPSLRQRLIRSSFPPELVACTKRPPGARKHDRADGRIIRTAGKRVVELQSQLMVDGVELLGPVQRYTGDLSAVLEYEDLPVGLSAHIAGSSK